MSLPKGKKEKEGQGRGTRAYRRRRVPGGRRRTGPFVLAGLLIVLGLAGAALAYSPGAYPAMDLASLRAGLSGGEDREGVARVVDPTATAGGPPELPAEPVAQPAGEEGEAAEADAADGPTAGQETATSEAVREPEAGRSAAQEEQERADAEEAAAVEAQRVAQEEQAATEARQIAAAEEADAETAEEVAAEEAAIKEEAALEEELPTEEGIPAQEGIPAEEEDEATPTAPPADPTMYLSVPKLGINGAIVADGEAGLELGAMHLAGTGYPWQPGSNTYVAGHRVGFPGTGSDRIFYDLPNMGAGDTVTLTDSLGQEYDYVVSEMFAVTPFDVWVTAPTGEDMVTLQVCTESPDDWFTIGPKLMDSGPESGRLIVRAVRV